MEREVAGSNPAVACDRASRNKKNGLKDSTSSSLADVHIIRGCARKIHRGRFFVQMKIKVSMREILRSNRNVDLNDLLKYSTPFILDYPIHNDTISME